MLYRQASILVAVLLAGCAGHSIDCEMGITWHENCAPGTAAYEERQEEKATKAAVGAIDDAKCQSYGFQPGSLGYAQCRKDFDDKDALATKPK